jgi:putative ABC transport system permease protein
MGHLELLGKNIRRRLFRNVATIMCFAFVTCSLLSAYFLLGGAQNSVNVGMERLGADILVVPSQYGDQSQSIILTGKPSTFTFEESVEGQVAGIGGVKQTSPQLYVATLSNQACCSSDVQLIGIDPQRDFTIRPWLVNELGRDLQPDEIIVGYRIIGFLGDELRFYGTNFTIAGRLEETGMGIDTVVFMSLDDAYTMAEMSVERAAEPLDITRGEISSVLVKVQPGQDVVSIADSIATNIPGTYPETASNLAVAVNDQLTATTQVLYATTLSVTIVSVPLVALVSSLVANERRRELGLLRAMGGTRSFIFSMVFSEAIVLAAIGGVIGVTISLLLIGNFQGLITQSLAIPFLWPSLSVIVAQSMLAVLLAVAVGGLAALYPAYKSSRLEPYEAIRKGET